MKLTEILEEISVGFRNGDENSKKLNEYVNMVRESLQEHGALYENEKIYIVDDYDSNNEKIKDDYLQLVYQQKDIENDNGKGLYYSIVNIDGITKFKLYTYLVETNYYNNIEWGKERNINFFENGYGAQRDLLQVKFIKKN